MDLVVLIMVLAIYVGAIAAPLSLFILARRTGHGPAWKGLLGLCTALVWVALILGFLQEFLNVSISRDVLEVAGFAAVISFAALAVLSLVLVTKSWPDRTAPKEHRYPAGRFTPFAADIE